MNRNFGLDFARAFAIILVLIAHFSKQHHVVGFWGVELFFALSGYLIGGILWNSYKDNSTWSIKKMFNFLSRRWWRTLPNYYLFFCIMILFHYLYKDEVLQKHIINYLWFGQNLLSKGDSFFGISWSLCIEEWFYLLFASTLFIIGKIHSNRVITFAGAIAVVISASVIMRLILSADNVNDDIRHITFARLDAIAYGVGVSFAWEIFGHLNKRIALIAGLIGMLLCVYSIVLFSAHLDFEGISEILILTPLGFAMTLPIMTYFNIPASFFSRCIENISKWSYSIYLSHIPILFMVYGLFEPYRNSSVGNLASKIVALFITFAVSACIYRFFEVPITNKRPKAI